MWFGFDMWRQERVQNFTQGLKMLSSALAAGSDLFLSFFFKYTS